jgi:hypothetical protein
MPHAAANEASTGLIDFASQKPEAVRGVRKSTKPVNWDALSLVVERSTGSALQKQVMKRKFFKAIREHGIEAMTPRFRYSYVCARLALGDFSDYFGWEFRDEWAARLYWDQTWLAKWGGGPVERLLVVGEQGLGDMIFYASIFPEAISRAKEVVFECDERLHPLFYRSYPNAIFRKERPFEDRREDYGTIDAFIPAADLMRMFRRKRSDFPAVPYLKHDAGRAMGFWNQYARRTAIAWRGRQGIIEPMKLDLDNPFSVQYKDFHREIEQPPIDLWADIDGLAAILSVADRLVTVPQTAHHIAGALGKRVDIICPELPGEITNQVQWDYSALLGRLPWYANATVYHDVADWKRRSGGQSAP